jgi:hypothetical protein
MHSLKVRALYCCFRAGQQRSRVCVVHEAKNGLSIEPKTADLLEHAPYFLTLPLFRLFVEGYMHLSFRSPSGIP